MTSFFTRSPLWIAHCIATRLITFGQADPSVAARAFIVMLVAMLTGCASLPDSVQRPQSEALVNVAETRLAALATASMPANVVNATNAAADASDSGLSGMRLLPAGDHAFEARIALARAAEKTIDAQYYQIADDRSGRQFLRELSDAAARGVRVRLLVDDLNAAGEDALLAGLAARPNVELRVFNPLPVREGSVNARVMLSMHEFSRINRRMHNKLLVADNAFAISGGRNVADEYFGRSEPANFIDMDMLSAGPVVLELSAVFDGYWNSEHAYPIQSLTAKDVPVAAARRFFDESVRPDGVAELPVASQDALGQSSVGTQMAAGQVELRMAAVRVIADTPAKVGAAQATLTDGPVMNGKLELLQSARSDVLVASPYFVPGRRTMEVLRQATDSRVRVSVMTNSLATTDEPLVHHGYARYRGALLQMGVALYELMPGAEGVQTVAGGPYGSVGRLHAKVAVVDQRWLYIGSMNMDRRSAHCNTEMGLIVESPELAGQMLSLLRGERLQRSYQVVRDAQGGKGLRWVSQEGQKQEVVHAAEPDSSWRLQLRMSVLSMFVNEELL